MWVTSSTAKALKPNAIALGNFDGIHKGHQQVVQPILNYFQTVGCSSITDGQERKTKEIYATVVTFNPHPREFFTGQSRKLLTPLPEKVKQLELLGVKQLVLLPFDKELASLSPQQFVETILVKQLSCSFISVGEDFRFGYKRAGTAEELKAIAAQSGIEVHITSLQTHKNDTYSDLEVRISSSLIRQALEAGDISKANRMLGRTYTFTGTVVAGQKLGRTIGFPTANLQLSAAKFLPRYGVYSVKVFLEDKQNVHNPSLQGVMNLGCRPTVDSSSDPILEVHLLDWSGDLYGQTITVSLEKFLRPEQKFPSLEALKAQIAFDCEQAREIIQSKV